MIVLYTYQAVSDDGVRGTLVVPFYNLGIGSWDRGIAQSAHGGDRP